MLLTRIVNSFLDLAVDYDDYDALATDYVVIVFHLEKIYNDVVICKRHRICFFILRKFCMKQYMHSVISTLLMNSIQFIFTCYCVFVNDSINAGQ